MSFFLSNVFEIIIAELLMDFFCQIFKYILCVYCKILIDLSKAFDCVSHGLLITKPKAYGLADDVCRFISSYLSGRFQRMSFKCKSTWEPLLKGIPQWISALPHYI